jgi:hypothetical protein
MASHGLFRFDYWKWGIADEVSVEALKEGCWAKGRFVRTGVGDFRCKVCASAGPLMYLGSLKMNQPGASIAPVLRKALIRSSV